MSTGSFWESDGSCLESTCCFMDWKGDTCEFRTEEAERSVVEERESEVVVGSDAVDEGMVDEGVAVEEEEKDEKLEECFLCWCLVGREETLGGVEDDVDGCL